MRTFTFDEVGNMTATEKTAGVDMQGNPVETMARHTIRAEQLARFLPMFAPFMTADQRAQAEAIIAAQE